MKFKTKKQTPYKKIAKIIIVVFDDFYKELLIVVYYNSLKSMLKKIFVDLSSNKCITK
jgi:hypothetical protein